MVKVGKFLKLSIFNNNLLKNKLYDEFGKSKREDAGQGISLCSYYIHCNIQRLVEGQEPAVGLKQCI